MVIDSTGSVGIGDTSPASMLTVGSGDLFQVNSSGNPVKINNVDYSWPASQGSANTMLTNDGSGNLSWSGGFINGSIMGGDWEVASDGLSVNVEELDVIIGNRAYNKTATAVATSGLTASTWYYLYAYVSGGAITFETSTTAPDSRRVWKTGGTTNRYLGALRTWNDSGTVRVYRAMKRGRITRWDVRYGLLSNYALTTSWSTEQSAAAAAPPTSRYVSIDLAGVTNDRTLQLSKDGSTVNRSVYLNSSAGSQDYFTWIPLSSTQTFWAKAAEGSCNIYLGVHAFEE